MRWKPGSTFIDTADVDGQGESEEIVGKALSGGRRDGVVLATKVWGPMGEESQPPRRLAPLDYARGRGTFTMAEDLMVTRMGYGAMQLAGPHVFGPPADRNAAVAVLAPRSSWASRTSTPATSKAHTS